MLAASLLLFLLYWRWRSMPAEIWHIGPRAVRLALFIIAFGAAPTMTAGHLLFAVATTVYIVIAVQLEERDLVESIGDQYRDYRREVPMLVPRPRRRAAP